MSGCSFGADGCSFAVGGLLKKKSKHVLSWLLWMGALEGLLEALLGGWFRSALNYSAIR